MNAKNARVLVVDDESDVLFAVKMLLKTEVKEVVTEKNPENLLSLLAKQTFDVVFLDMNYKSALNTGNEGLYWLHQILAKDKSHSALPGGAPRPVPAVVMITAYGDVELAVRALKEGATDFILKPWRNEKLLEALEKALEKRNASGHGENAPRRVPTSGIPATAAGSEMLGESEAMQDVFYKIDKIAPTEANVLILGENGTGKELVARALHQKSVRAGQPFITADLAALSEGLFESELFGHKKGAFTDAKEDRMGRFEAAHGGTLFLDEIGNISLPQQAKILTVLQNRLVTPLGSNQNIPIDIRLVSATNVPIYELAAQNQFRKDLIYRINTVEITLPPLRERGGDVALLARHFAAHYAAKNHKPVPYLSDGALKKLQQHTWPGNIRELQHAVERAIILADGEELRPPDFSFSAMESPVAAAGPEAPEAGPLQLSEVERATIQRVIERHKGNISKAAKELGITRTALYRRLEKHDI